MTHGSHYLGKLYNDLIANSPQTISIDIPSDMGKGRIAQTQIKHGIIFSDWQMCYQSDMNVQGTVSKDYMQIIFCLNDAISWGIMDEKRSITIQKNESCIYAGHGGTEYACYKKDSNFSFKSIKIPIAYFSQLLTDYFDGQEATAYEKKLLDAQYHFCSHAGSHCCCWTGGRPDWRIYRPESIEKAFHQGWTRFCKITRTAP